LLGGQTVEIKLIENYNSAGIIQLVTDVFMEFEAPDYTDEGITVFFDTAINNQDFMSSLAIYGAYINYKLVGVIATRNNGKHIALFFVNGSYHRKGIGRKLFETVLQNSVSNEITVNSSPYAKDIYHNLGFKDTDIEQTVTGIRFIPMSYRL
jgi:GNAT superfamily N-acetyltransferase